jgi:hypothetical protein
MATNTSIGSVADAEQDAFAVAFRLRVLLQQYAFADVDLPKHRDTEAKRNPPREMLLTPRQIAVDGSGRFSV